MAKKKETTSSYKVLVLSNTFVEGRLRTKGETVVVSEDYYNRVKLEGDQQLKAII